MRKLLLCAIATGLTGGLFSGPVEGAAGDGKFTRCDEDKSGMRLQTGVASYRNKDGVTVDLIGAIHIADLSYYEKLNKRFTRYDAMLYEMVGESYEERMKKARELSDNSEKAPMAGSAERAEESKASRRLAWLHPMYETMEKSLGLAGQMKGIDYSAKNFVHADMTAREFAEMQRQKNESFLSLWWKTVVQQSIHPENAPPQPGLLKILESLCKKDPSVGLRRAAAKTFGQMESVIAGVESDDGTVILTERNKVAIGVLEEQMQLGKRCLAIFYGAAHMADMEKRLLSMGFERTGGEWFTAWDIPPESQEGALPQSGPKHAD